MTTELYRSFESKLDVGQRTGFIISALDNGRLRIKSFSVYTDEPEYTYYIMPTEQYNADTAFTRETARELLEQVQRDAIKPYRVQIDRKV